MGSNFCAFPFKLVYTGEDARAPESFQGILSLGITFKKLEGIMAHKATDAAKIDITGMYCQSRVLMFSDPQFLGGSEVTITFTGRRDSEFILAELHVPAGNSHEEIKQNFKWKISEIGQTYGLTPDSEAPAGESSLDLFAVELLKH